MAKYGISLENEYDFKKDAICPLFTSYFSNPEMIKLKDVNNYSMYITEIHAILGIEKRYLIVFVKQNTESLGNKKRLSDLKWQSLQTRTFGEEMFHDKGIPLHSYSPRIISELNQKIVLTHKDSEQYVYSVEKLPLQIVLLPKTKNLDYNNTGKVIPALETYYTLVNFY
jgi:hypothetical protein